MTVHYEFLNFNDQAKGTGVVISAQQPKGSRVVLEFLFKTPAKGVQAALINVSLDQYKDIAKALSRMPAKLISSDEQRIQELEAELELWKALAKTSKSRDESPWKMPFMSAVTFDPQPGMGQAVINDLPVSFSQDVKNKFG